ncbi:MAG: DUF998 domain-containing protein [Oscillochloridaceae bacterium umkhey_bin13]
MSQTNLLPSIIATLITAYLLVGLIWFVRWRPDYRHTRHTISELGERGSADGARVNALLFAPVGLALLAMGGWAMLESVRQPLREPFGYLALAIGVGYLGGAIFPCDPGSPMQGSWRQQLHNLAGGVEYVGGALAIYLAANLLTDATFLGSWLLASAGVVALVAVGLSFTLFFPVRGLIQRIGELTLFTNVIVLA